VLGEAVGRDRRAAERADGAQERVEAMKPTHRLKALNKLTNNRCEVGAGWLNANGSISVRLNPCIVLRYDPEIVITLFPVDREPSHDAEG
jgi:hypothetical protein